MAAEFERRAAASAIVRFGADRGRVKQAVRAVLRARQDGQPADLLDLLVVERLLTPVQADELRRAFDVTQLALTPRRPPPARPRRRPPHRPRRRRSWRPPRLVCHPCWASSACSARWAEGG